MIRGELWSVAGGADASKPRPALILQGDAFDGGKSVTVAPLTSNLVDAPLLRVRIPRSETSGLDHDSDVMVDKLTTVRRTSVGKRFGGLTSDQLVQVERAVMVFLGFAR